MLCQSKNLSYVLTSFFVCFNHVFCIRTGTPKSFGILSSASSAVLIKFKIAFSSVLAVVENGSKMNRENFEPHPKDKNEYSIWFYFLKSCNSSSAKCKSCGAVLKTLGGSTKGLHTHLSSIHKKKVPTGATSTSTPKTASSSLSSNSKSKGKITNFFSTEKETLDLVMSRMIALDGFSFYSFVSSQDLRQLLISKGYTDLPSSPTTVRNRVVKFSERVREKIIQEMQREKFLGKKFAITFDEWTSTANRRYMNINVHSEGKFWSLGLLRVKGSMTAENCKDLVSKRLEDHKLSLTKDIVAIVTDGPNVMVKVGNLINAEHQLCFAHGLHLAVCDVLYKKKAASETQSQVDKDSAADQDNAEDLSDKQILDDQESDDDDDDDLLSGSNMNLEFANSSHEVELSSQGNIDVIIKKIRKVVLIFKRSTTKKDSNLSKYVIDEKGKDLSLLLDCKTRWNSLYTMLDRFMFLKSCVQKALIDLESPITIDENEFRKISDLLDVLAPIKLAAEKLCRREANLCSAEEVLKLMMEEVSTKSSDIARKMTEALEKRIGQRRKLDVSGVLQYLRNPDSNSTKIFQMANATTVREKVKLLIERLDSRTLETDMHSDSDQDSNDMPLVEEDQQELTLEEKFTQAVNKSKEQRDPKTKSSGKDLVATLKKEMFLFQSGGTRGLHLELAFQYLAIVPPTSVESERAFSAAGQFVTKIRSRLADNTLDALMLLRSYFQKQRQTNQ